jgi:DNA-binding transcriptional LysR family regulator
MEIFELKYFLGVAAQENVHRASEKLNVSPASLSKAITRLEDELSVKLFSRDGRNIKLTDHGRLLQKRASEMIQLEELTTLELSGHKGTIQVVMAGPEVLLSQMGMDLSGEIRKKYPLAVFDYVATDDESALESVVRGQAHMALVTDDVPVDLNLSVKTMGKTSFQTFVGVGHPLYALAKAHKEVSIEEVLKHSFVSPSNPLLGKVGAKQSLDGWRDDKFPRKVTYKTSSLKIMEELLVSGKAIAYLPDYFALKLKVEVLNVVGCPYSCQQKIKLVARNTKSVGWLNQIF